MRLPKRAFKKTTLTYFQIMLMKIKDVKDLDLKTRLFDDINNNDNMKAVNDIKDLNLKMF